MRMMRCGPWAWNVDVAWKVGRDRSPVSIAISKASWPVFPFRARLKPEAPGSVEGAVLLATIRTPVGDEHVLLDGHYQWRDAAFAGRTELPAYVLTHQESLDAMIAGRDYLISLLSR